MLTVDDPSCAEVFLAGHSGFSAVFAVREDASGAAEEAYAAEQVAITSRVRFFTQRAFAR